MGHRGAAGFIVRPSPLHPLLFCGAVLLSPYFLNFFLKLLFLEKASSTGLPASSAFLTAFTSSAFTAENRFVTLPLAPHRAVRPILWRYSAAFPANSACTTCATPGTSTPRAALSVHTNTSTNASASEPSPPDS